MKCNDVCVTRCEIARVGTYLATDESGFIVKQSSAASIQARWWPVVEAVVRAYRTMCGDSLHSVYIRGSVAAGNAIDGVSDVDALAIVEELTSSSNADRVREVYCELARQFPFVTRFELRKRSLSQARAHRPLQMVILVQAVCVFGQDLAAEFPKFRADRYAAFESRAVLHDIAGWIRALMTLTAPSIVREHSTLIARRVLRAGFELVMERESRFTRDLYLCYESFAKYYPNRANDMYEFLELAVNPTDDPLVLARALLKCRRWLETEIANVLDGDQMTGQRVPSP